MRPIRGTLVTCDAPVKQLILALDEQDKCVIEDLDETHVLVRSDRVEWLKGKLEFELEKNTWKVNDGA